MLGISSDNKTTRQQDDKTRLLVHIIGIESLEYWWKLGVCIKYPDEWSSSFLPTL